MASRLLPRYEGSGLLVELLFFGRAGQRLDRGRTALDHGGDVVEVAGTDFLLVRDEGVAHFARCEFRFLNHFNVVLHAFAASVSVGELEGVEPVDVDAGQGDELILVAQRGQLVLEGGNGLVVQVLLPVVELKECMEKIKKIFSTILQH